MGFVRLSFDVTSACNLKCAHCMRMDRDNAVHFPMDVFEKILNQCKRYGTKTIIFTGGEPFLHPQIIEMVDMVAKGGFRYFIVTNGTWTDKLAKLVEDEERRKYLDSISMSLEGATEETCDAIRGEGTYRKVMSSSAYLKAKKVHFGYKLSVNTLNVGELEKYTADAMKLGATYVEFSHMHPTRDLIKHGLILPRSEWRNVEAELARIRKMFRLLITICAGGYCDYPFYQCSSMQMLDVHIDCHADMHICCILPYYSSSDPKKDKAAIAGNLAQMDLWDAHKRLVPIMARLNQSKIRKIANNTFSEIDHYSCIYCLKQFGKLDWLKELDPDNEWIRE